MTRAKIRELDIWPSRALIGYNKINSLPIGQNYIYLPLWKHKQTHLSLTLTLKLKRWIVKNIYVINMML